MDAKRVGEYLALLRKQRGMTQQESAERLGVSNKTISKWENGGGLPDISVLPALAELYGVTADEILAGNGKAAADGSAVEEYLRRREEFRYRLGTAAALLCWTAGILCYFYSYRRIWVWLLLLGGHLALWLGWSHMGAERFRERMQLLFPVLAVQLHILMDHWFRMNILGEWLEFRVFWALLLILWPVLYAALRSILRRREPAAALYPKSCFRTLVTGWCAATGLYLYRWYLELPGIRAYQAAHPYWQRRKGDEWLNPYPQLDLAFPAILTATFTVFLLLLLYHRARETSVEVSRP